MLQNVIKYRFPLKPSFTFEQYNILKIIWKLNTHCIYPDENTKIALIDSLLTIRKLQKSVDSK